MPARARLAALLVLVVAGAACTRAHAPAQTDAAVPQGVPAAELRPAADAPAILAAARALMERDGVVALATVDAGGQPRVRSVRAFLDPVDPARPASGFTVWILTRHTTRKVEQVRRHPQVTLYFNDDAGDSYASIMGTATVHTDPDHPAAKRHYDDELVKFFWPDFPRDFVMIEVRPRWLEFIGPAAENDDRTWRPQAVVFDE
ncbi:MAG TPA: pyridoxamine 5'-phosphate oxidase family protein [Vicinamibacterales bacterium]|nr:pyridoxamine 5'-phosphate oxidase family protein [Vicinamibacterales bacterium]